MVTEWIIPCNIKYYDVISAFKKFKSIDWKQSKDIKVGDIVYIYIGKPFQQIKYKCIVTINDLKEASRHDSEFILDGTQYIDYGRYMRLELIDEYIEGMFTSKELEENGVNFVQGLRTVPDTLSTFIKRSLEEGDYAYSNEYRSPISILVNEWEELLKSDKIFRQQDIELLKRIYSKQNHATTCYALGKEDGKHPSSYILQIVNLGKRISKQLGLREVIGTEGKAVWWRILFWGDKIDSGHYEWKIRPELARALENQFPQLVEDRFKQVIKDFEAELEQISFNSNTEKEVMVRARLGHGELKKYILKKEHSCRICGLQDEKFLIASHIKPWSVSNEKERLDENNILLLCPAHDAAFDKGYISFDEDGKLLISTQLTMETRALLNLREGQKINLREDNKEYMRWHRENIFKL